jgi:uncharacterized protein YyaL (SSP411 family)
MLYDNAQLLRVFSRAARVYHKDRYAQVARDTAAWMLSELADPTTGLFGSSWDADSEGEEGAYYVWRPDQLNGMADRVARAALEKAFGLGGYPNFEGHSHVLNRSKDWDPRQPALLRGLAALRRLRSKRVPPARDDTVVVGWNGLAVCALAEAGQHLGQPDWIAHAGRIAEHLLASRRGDGTLPRTLSKDAPAGVLLDHAAVAEGLLALHAATGEAHWLISCRELALATVANFLDTQRGDFRQSLDNTLIAQRRSLDDGAEPSGQGRLLTVLVTLEQLGCEGLPTGLCHRVFETMSTALSEQPAARPGSISALMAHLSGGSQVVVTARSAAEPGLVPLLREAGGHWIPGASIAVGHGSHKHLGPLFSVFGGREPTPAGSNATVCIHRTCGLPVQEAKQLREQLLAALPRGFY